MTVAEARMAAQAHRLEVQTGGIPKKLRGTSVSLADYLRGEYLDRAKASKRSWKADESKIRCHLIPFMGEKVRLSDVTEADVEAYLEHLLSKGLAESTRDRHLALIGSVYREAKKLGWVNHSPTDGLSMLLPDNAKRRFLDRDELDRLMRVCQSAMQSELPGLNPEVAALTIFLVSTGLRVGEALCLTFDDFNRSTHTLYLAASKTKSKKSRHIPLNGTAEFIVLEQLEKHGTGYLFQGTNPGKAISANLPAFKRLVRAAGLSEDLSFHTLRKTFISQLLMSGVDVFTVSKLAGHSSVVTTEKAYGFLSAKALSEAASKADSFIKLDDLKEKGRDDE